LLIWELNNAADGFMKV